ncbi:Retrovirus-related Pol polyprotein from transposon RE1 [Vitis vinifera]|uniref:Retrovirus-related Pol polyprotein from transposon RE1 n=1 Tax=Vitis vinifera TaxID=29760 RepID=A0A438H913_VITVI|nr:Retrovirus-related Pol polyprotein from transposon RE1 [Vitis vinifera]RVW81030.1 Retrovirus-related Pol polyprotein from transposon RE1 [Vitis vinifera]
MVDSKLVTTSMSTSQLSSLMDGTSLTDPTEYQSIVGGWTTDRDARTLTNAYVMFWGHNAISWSSKKQRFVACFSTEAEHRVVALTSYELLCLKSLLLELGVLVPTPMSIYRDNFGTTYLCTNPVIILE